MHHERPKHPHLYRCALNLEGRDGGRNREERVAHNEPHLSHRGPLQISNQSTFMYVYSNCVLGSERCQIMGDPLTVLTED